MDDDALRTYLNDHLAGATLGVDHARKLEGLFEGHPFGVDMSRIATEIEEDRDTLIELMGRLDLPRNPLKQATAWAAEKAGRVKFSGATRGDAELGRYLALETMSLGVEGKQALWTALQRVASTTGELAGTDFEHLAERARNQRAALERQRLESAIPAFAEPQTASHG